MVDAFYFSIINVLMFASSSQETGWIPEYHDGIFPVYSMYFQKKASEIGPIATPSPFPLGGFLLSPSLANQGTSLRISSGSEEAL